MNKLALLSLSFLFAPVASAVDVTVYDGAGGVTQNPVNVADKAFFAADETNDSVFNSSLWVAVPGSSVVSKLTDGCNPGELTAVGSILFFTCSSSAGSRELWRSNGTPSGTFMVKDINPGTLQSAPTGLTNVNGTLFFSAIFPGAGRELGKSDGTSGGTVIVSDITAGTSGTTFSVFPGIPNFVAVGATLFFVIDSDRNDVNELWKSDGTSSGTVPVTPGFDLNISFSGDATTFAPVANMISYAGELYFAGNTSLWKSDGSPEGTVQLNSLAGSGGPFSPDDFAVADETLFFAASDNFFGRELWKTDGTASGTNIVKDINPSQFQSSLPSWLTGVNELLFFQATDGARGFELWKSDGTSAGTQLVANINPNGDSYPGKPANANSKAFFSADDGTNGDELWKSAGSEGDTVLVADIVPGASGSFVDEPVLVGDWVFFTASNGTSRVVMAVEADPPDPKTDGNANYIYAATDLDPVNTFTGELFDRKPPDIDLGGPMPLYFQRYYASYTRRGFVLGDLGSNWRHNFDARLFVSGNTATFVSNDGRVTKFLLDLNSGDWDQQTNEDTPYQLATGAGEDARLYDPESGQVYTFDYTSANTVAGRLIKVEDGHGNAHTIDYDLATGNLSLVTDGLGRTLSFFYNTDVIPKLSVISSGSRSVSFEYNDPIDTEYLIKVTDVMGGITTYQYEDTSETADYALMTYYQRPEGNIPYLQTYFEVPSQNSGKVKTQTDASGNTHTFDYNNLTTTLTDPNGNTRIHTHTSTGELADRTDQAGSRFSMGTDSKGRRKSLRDREGDTTSYGYHEETGKLSEQVFPDGTSRGYSYQPRAFGDLTLYDVATTTNADGGVNYYQYDTAGNVVSHIDPIGQVSTATFSDRGQPLTRTNPAGGTKSYSYNADGTLATVTDPAGNQTSFTYDAERRPSQTTFADGSTQGYTYNKRNQLVTETDGKGNTTAFEYDGNGNQTRVTDPLGGAFDFAFDGNDRLIMTTSARGGVSQLGFDALGRPATTTDPNGNVTTTVYDTLGREVATVDPLGNTWSYSYTLEGVLASTTNPLNQTTTFQSDSLGRNTATTSALGHMTTTGYDSAGRIIATTDGLGRTTTTTRNALGLPITLTRADQSSIEYGYSFLGQLTSITDPLGATWARGYDNSGRQISATDPLGQRRMTTFNARNLPDTVSFPGAMGTQTLTYDAVTNLTGLDYSDGERSRFRYDAKNQLTAANAGGNTPDTVSRSYNADGQLTQTNGIVVTRDIGGRITALQLAPGKNVTYQYDANDRLTTVADWVGGTTRFVHDNADRLIRVERPNGITTQNTWDADVRLIGITESNGSNISLTLDAAGQTTSAVRNVPLQASLAVLAGVSQTFDAASQIQGYAYDALGRVTAGAGRSYSWDLASRLRQYQENANTVSHTYDALGRRIARSESGLSREFVWNDAFLLESISIEVRDGTDHRYYIHTPSGLLLHSVSANDNSRRFFHYDEMGNTLFLTSDSGSVSDSYAHSPYGQLLARSGSEDNPFTWQGQFGVMDENNGLYYLRARFYDSLSQRFISRDPVTLTEPDQTNPYEYALGNPGLFNDPTGLNPGDRKGRRKTPDIASREANRLHGYQAEIDKCSKRARELEKRLKVLTRDEKNIYDSIRWHLDGIDLEAKRFDGWLQKRLALKGLTSAMTFTGGRGAAAAIGVADALGKAAFAKAALLGLAIGGAFTTYELLGEKEVSEKLQRSLLQGLDRTTSHLDKLLEAKKNLQGQLTFYNSCAKSAQESYIRAMQRIALSKPGD